MNDIIFDEIQSMKGVLDRRLSGGPGQYTYYVARHHCVFGDYLLAALEGNVQNVYAVPGGGSLNKEIIDNDKRIEWLPEGELPADNACCLFVVDCLDSRYCDEAEYKNIEEELIRWCQYCREDDARLICCWRVPSPLCPDEITCLAEREYDAFLARKSPTSEEALYLRLEDVLRKQVRDSGACADMIRFDNIIGPECWDLVQSMDFTGLMNQMVSTGTISITENDAGNNFTLLDIREAVAAVIYVMSQKNSSYGQVYNASGNIYAASEIKWSTYRQFSDKLSLSVEAFSPICKIYHGLNNLRLRHIGWKLHRKLNEICYRQGCYALGESYDMTRFLSVYRGRLDEIKHQEMEILKFVDSVCKENDIRYFLAGGSCLGAIRHKGFIPWDDDIDVGMLREDYERFREICPKVMPDSLTYEDVNGVGGSHYHFDKIRLKDTYFATNYSAHFKINNGLFFDILVYDQTSNKPFFQRMHIRLIALFSQILNVKWWNSPRRKKGYYWLQKLGLPIMRHISWDRLHKIFERIACHYRKKENAQYVIDTMGQNIKKGVMRKEWMSETEYVPFEDTTAPVPAGYNNYLAHLYGPQYMEYLPIGSRVSGHSIARLDLGEYVFDDSESGKCRHIDLRGELYELDNESN